MVLLNVGTALTAARSFDRTSDRVNKNMRTSRDATYRIISDQDYPKVESQQGLCAARARRSTPSVFSHHRGAIHDRAMRPMTEIVANATHQRCTSWGTNGDRFPNSSPWIMKWGSGTHGGFPVIKRRYRFSRFNLFPAKNILTFFFFYFCTTKQVVPSQA